MKHLATLLAAATLFATFGGSVSAKTIWEQLSESAPRSENPVVASEMVVPRSVFTDLANSAPRMDTFGDLSRNAP